MTTQASISRRELITGTVAAALASPLMGVANAAAPRGIAKPVKMVAGTQQGPTTPEMLRYFKRCGVTHVCGLPTDHEKKGYFSVDDLTSLKHVCEAEGIVLSMIPLPFLSSSHVDRESRPAIVLGQSPEREKDLEDLIRTIEACHIVGIPAVKYNLSLLGVMRTGITSGRGSAEYDTYRLADRQEPTKLTRAGIVSASEFWDRIDWFLSKIVPAANSYQIKIACHPQDPGTPPGGLHGIHNVLGTPDGLKKFIAMHESPFHGLNFCLGTVAEMLQDPRNELPAIVEYFAERKKIFNIHFRNIRGNRDEFMEVFPDEGDLDLPAIAALLAKHDYDGMLMPDHAPHHESDPKGLQGFAYEMGYIKGVLQTL